MKQLTTIELFKDYQGFSAGHFTIFSATRREKLHGHNFSVYAAITAEVEKNGMAFDYAIYKNKIRQLCKQLHSYFLLPAHSPHLKIIEDDDYYYGLFDQEKIPFLKSDVLILPLRNITIEELSNWFLQQLINDSSAIEEHLIHAITIKVFSGKGQGACAIWEKKAL